MDTSVLDMLRGSQCESAPFEHDLQGFQLGTSLVETCTRFLACMVDTQDYICQMKNTYVKELWPNICSEMTESKSRVIGLEKELADCKEEKEENRRYYTLQVERLRMSSEDERGHWLREVDSLQDRLRKEGRCESTLSSERGLETNRPNDATNFEFRCAELERQNQLLGRRIEAYDKSNSELSTSNEDLTKELQIRTDQIEELKKAVEIAHLKQQFREQQRSLQEDTEDRYKRERRLYLKKQRHSQSNSHLECRKGEQGREDCSLSKLQLLPEPGLLQCVGNLRSSIGELKNCDISVPVVKPAASSPKNIRCLAPGIKRIDLEADVATTPRKIPNDPINGKLETEEMFQRPKLEKNAKGNSTTREIASVPKPSSSRVAEYNSAVETGEDSFVLRKTIKRAGLKVADAENPKADPFSAHQAEVPAMPTAGSEETSAENAKQPSVSCNSGSCLNEDLAGNENSGLADVSRVSGELASSTRAKQCSPVDRGLKQKTRVSETAKNSFEQTTRTSTHSKKTKERKWMHTRSRTEEANGEDAHDSFLNTPREVVMANLKSRGESNRIQQLDPRNSPSAELRYQSRNKGPSSTPSGLHTGEKEPDLAAPFEWTDDCELGDMRSVGSKASVSKSASSSDGAENLEKGCRPSSGARTNSIGRDKQAARCKAPGYKFNEPVRKKREREQLEATDCLQCRKFYDAVLAEDAEGVTMDRCEHHDAVSRHRYKYLPPGTPAGFWNIGFDSET